MNKRTALSRYDSAFHRYLARLGSGGRERVVGIPRTLTEGQAGLRALGSLRRSGWQASLNGRAQTGDGEALPWMTYSVIRYLDNLDLSGCRVLEFGSGTSTEWLSRRCAQLLTIEHDPAWSAQIPELPNVEVAVVPVGEDDPFVVPWPSQYVQRGGQGAPWDVVVIDGVGRQTCAEHVDEFVRSDGLVVLDDTDQRSTDRAVEALMDAGFGRIDFWGFRPGLAVQTCTSVFSRDFGAWTAAGRVPVSRGQDR